MCFPSVPKQSGPPTHIVTIHDDVVGNDYPIRVEDGVPDEYAKRGAQTITQYQQMAATDLSDKQIASQKEIAQKQQDFAQKQADLQQQQIDEQKKSATEQAQRQTDYDTGRSKQIAAGSQAIDQAFSRFTQNNDVYDKYASDYMSKALDDLNYPKREAQKYLQFQLARQGIQSSQAGVNQGGILEETAGRAAAAQSANAQTAVDNLRSSVLASKQNLQSQLQQTMNIGSPIAGTTAGDVTNALNTQRNAITGLQNNAGDVVANINPVPSVSPLSNIFAGILGSGAGILQGLNANDIRNAAARGLAGNSPSGGDSTTIRVL